MHHFFTGLVYCVEELRFLGSIPGGRWGFLHLSVWINSTRLCWSTKGHVQGDIEQDLASKLSQETCSWCFLSPKLPDLREHLSGSQQKTCSAILGSWEGQGWLKVLGHWKLLVWVFLLVIYIQMRWSPSRMHWDKKDEDNHFEKHPLQVGGVCLLSKSWSPRFSAPSQPGQCCQDMTFTKKCLVICYLLITSSKTLCFPSEEHCRGGSLNSPCSAWPLYWQRSSGRCSTSGTQRWVRHCHAGMDRLSLAGWLTSSSSHGDLGSDQPWVSSEV